MASSRSAIREGQLADVDRPCIEIGVSKVASITLEQPLIVVADLDSEGGNDS